MVFARDATTGALTHLPPDDPGGITFFLVPDGTHAYATAYPFSVHRLERNALTGRLTDVATEPAGDDALTFEETPDGRHVYAGVSIGVVILARDTSTGDLTYVDEMLRGGGDPDTLAISPDGRHLYASCMADNVATFARDASTGTLSEVQRLEQDVDGLNGLRQPGFLTISPDGDTSTSSAAAPRPTGVSSTRPSRRSSATERPER
jgi:hypothetical protein